MTVPRAARVLGSVTARTRTSLGSVRRRLRTAGGYVIRKAGLLPGGVADGLGEDAALLGRTLPHEIMVFFPDPPGSVYQLEQWYAPLRELDQRHRVVIVVQDSRTARLVRRDSGLDCIVVARYTTMDDLVSRGAFTAALYVNYNPDNGQNLRFTSLVHIHLLHGDSDKSVTVSHQTKGYDFLLVAGQAAIDRMAAYTMFHDVAQQCVIVGRPQLDHWHTTGTGRRHRGASEAPTVLYAPTWEGADTSGSYGSVESLGLRIVETFVGADWTVIYRPHPLTGVKGDPRQIAADRSIRELITGASSPARPHRVDAGVDLATSFGDADLLVCDVSAVAVDWLAVDRPMMITAPMHEAALPSGSALTRSMPAVSRDNLPDLAATARRQVDDDPLRAERRQLTRYYLGDVAAGGATERFLGEIERLLALRDREQDRLRAARAARL